VLEPRSLRLVDFQVEPSLVILGAISASAEESRHLRAQRLLLPDT
jgi:hypothetical protein